MAAILQEAPVQAALQIASPMLAVGGAEGTIGAKVAPSEVPYKLVERPQELIQEGTSVLLDINGEKTSFAVVKKTLKVRVGKNLVSLEPLIGLPFGSKFEVRTGPNTADLVPVSAAKAAEAAKAREETPGTEGEEGPSGGNGKQREEMVQSLVAKVTEERALKVGASPAAVKKDNRALVDNNTAQALSKEDVEELRRQGLSGQEIIQALVANSATFSGKTEFSQEKYLKKKQKKYAPQMTVRRPSGRSVCEAYFNKNPEKTCHLRTDSLSFLLAMSNASAHHDVLVFETCGGLVTAAVAERLGGHGTLCSTYSGPRPDSIDLARMFNFDEATANSISRASMQSLVDGRSKKGENAEASGRELDEATQAGEEEGARMGADVDVATAGGEPASATGASEMDVDEKPSNSKQGPSEVDEGATDGWRNLGVGLESNEEEAKGSGLRTERNEVGVSGEGPVEAEGTGWRGLGVGDETVTGSEAGPSNRATKAAERKARRDEKRKAEGGGNKGNRLGMAASEELLQQWARQGFTSLVVAAPNFQPLAVAQVMLPLLAPSSCFAFYHTSLQPLAECMHWLQVNRKAVALQLGEPWLREYQVLPARTHPQMQMSATGGYVLSGITIVEEANPVEEENKSKEAGNKRKRGKGAPPRGGGGKRGRGR